MSTQLSELCTLLVEEIYGELPAQIIEVLSEKGRLPLPQICRATSIPLRRVKHALAILIQQNLVLFHPTNQADITHYEVNTPEAYFLVRLGRAENLIEHRLGKIESDTFSTLLTLGHATRQELHSSQEHDSTTTNGNAHVNGDESPTNHTSTRLPQIPIEALEDAEYIEELRPHSQMPPYDFHLAVEESVRRENHQKYGASINGPKKAADFKTDVKSKKRQIRDEDFDLADEMKSESEDSDPEQDSEKRCKRRKLGSSEGIVLEDNQAEAGAIENGTDPELCHKKPHRPDVENLPWMRVNWEKVNTSFRSQCLTDFAANCLGNATAKVYLSLLCLLERNTPRCYDQDAADGETGQEASVSTLDLVHEIEAHPDIVSTLKEFQKASVEHARREEELDDDADHRKSKKPKLKANGTSITSCEPIHFDNIEDLQHEVLQHLHILYEHPHEFVTPVSNITNEVWSVHFHDLTQLLIQRELETCIISRFSPRAADMVRLLHDKGKLDEKQITQFGLGRPKDCRAELTAMQEAGYVSVQEVPRDTTRQPSRTIYLWYFDKDNCRQLLLDETYKSMSRILQRAKVEKQKVHSVIAKSERTDVRGKEEELLSKAELAALRTWERKEEKLLLQLARQDRLVMVLRDFLPPIGD